MPRRVTNSAGPHPVDTAVGERVRLRRLQLPMSQTELADQIGVTFQQIQKYEKGTNRISCSKLTEMAAAMECPISFFFSDGEDASEMIITENWDATQKEDGLRLIAAFGKIEKSKQKKLVALAESMVHAKE